MQKIPSDPGAVLSYDFRDGLLKKVESWDTRFDESFPEYKGSQIIETLRDDEVAYTRQEEVPFPPEAARRKKTILMRVYVGDSLTLIRKGESPITFKNSGSEIEIARPEEIFGEAPPVLEFKDLSEEDYLGALSKYYGEGTIPEGFSTRDGLLVGPTNYLTRDRWGRLVPFLETIRGPIDLKDSLHLE